MPKSMKIALLIVLSLLLLSLAFGVGCVINLNSPVGGLDTPLLNQAWGIISRNYVTPESVTPDKLNQGAVRV